jgi:uncharacterized protein (DUF362 family)
MMYGTVRSLVHQEGIKLEPTGTSAVTVDMVKANKLGLSVIDATTAMQGQGPSTSQGGTLVDMNLIIASNNALAADMVAANIMGFELDEIVTFTWAWKAGMHPSDLKEIQIVGEKIEKVRQQFKILLLLIGKNRCFFQPIAFLGEYSLNLSEFTFKHRLTPILYCHDQLKRL